MCNRIDKCGDMEYFVNFGPNVPLDAEDGLNPARALILEAYYALRRTCRPGQIGAPQIVAWIKREEPDESVPSESLIALTLRLAGVKHRGPGRPRRDSLTPGGTPLFLPRRVRLP